MWIENMGYVKMKIAGMKFDVSVGLNSLTDLNLPNIDWLADIDWLDSLTCLYTMSEAKHHGGNGLTKPQTLSIL